MKTIKICDMAYQQIEQEILQRIKLHNRRNISIREVASQIIMEGLSKDHNSCKECQNK